ncbi:AI-2E family transporter [Janthinobacterium agaricidamnosum]|uniref:AI-2E family transporter n=1 Tax=Janthinobacterium agaricidamnosum TaxID=55508 RepID=A0A3G2ECG9_9BURK|nr:MULTISPECIES: AI-2E family transporter [Janthinobacterium]AYM77602.1 AI-2E family transporter [Janthinobacterium agaricidamnosum]OEZ80734.1 putative inner membrane protein [Janthinobacterium sp. HH106]
MPTLTLHQKVFLLLLSIVTIGFGWILAPYAGAIFWGVILAILFAPVYRWLLAKTRGRAGLASLLTLLLIIVIVILPLSLISVSLVNQAASVVEMVRSGEITVAMFFNKIMAVLPQWLINLLERFNLTSLASLQDKLAEGATQVSQVVAVKAINVGLYTFEFLTSLCIMLYLLFFLMRDGSTLSARIKNAVPLSRKYKQRLFTNFTTVIRATVKGNILVAIAQGALGGLAFWFLDVPAPLLWAVLMAFLSLLPAVGAALVWAPVAAYFLATGAIWQGAGLAAFGVFVIGLVDNVLRPILVGKDTKMPDYVVLLSTVGGMALFGLNGFVIGPVVAALFIASWDLFVSASEFQAED